MDSEGVSFSVGGGREGGVYCYRQGQTPKKEERKSEIVDKEQIPMLPIINE